MAARDPRRVGTLIAAGLRDVRHACRSIARMPALAAVVVVSLGAGIGVNTVVFSWIQAVVSKPIPGVADASSFFLVEPRTETGIYPGAAWPEYRDARERLRTFQHLIAYRMVPLYVGETGKVERAYGLLVSGNYFSALGLRPVLGRFLTDDDVAKPGREPVAVISYDYWRDRLGGPPDVINRTIRVNGNELAVIGVAPKGFQGTALRLNFDVWLPATLAPSILPGSRELDDRTVRGYSIMGRLQPSATPPHAQSELDGVMRQLATEYPKTNAALRAEILNFWQAARGPQRFLVTALSILQGIMLLLLLAVCGNTANLVLARASTRQREMGVRLALGAGPWRIVSLMLVENVLMALPGAALGAAIAIWGTKALPDFRFTGFPIRFETDLDAVGLAFAIALGIVCGLIFGAAPAAQLARVDPVNALRAGAKSSSRSGLRNALMAVQVGLAVLVLIFGALLFRSFMETRSEDTGFRRNGIMLAAYDLTGRTDPTNPALPRVFAQKLVARLTAAPAVDAAAISASVPLDIHGLPSRIFTLDGRSRTEEGDDRALTNVVTPGYFETLDIALCAGTDFADLLDATAPAQAIVNEAFVRRYLNSTQPDIALGRGLRLRGERYTVVGVARNSLYNAFGEPPTPIIYLSYRDRPPTSGEIHVRARAGSESAVAEEIRRAVRDLDPDLPIYNVRTLTDHIENNLILRRIPARMFTVLGPLILVLAAIGIYAVVAYTVSLRTSEIGIRLALGATTRRVIAQFVGQSLLIICVGALFGWLVAFIAVYDFIPGGTIDPSAFVGVPVVLVLVAAIACWLPARRAAKVAPMVALRQD
jgi:predicted permease